MTEVRDWQKDKETVTYLKSWILDPGGTEDAAAFYTIEDHVFTDVKADGMLFKDARLLNDAFNALEYYHQQYAVEKERAHRLNNELELAYYEVEKLQEEYFRLDEEAAKDYDELVATKERAGKAKELLWDALGSLVLIAGPKNEHVKRIRDGIRSIYPLEKEGKSPIKCLDDEDMQASQAFITRAMKEEEAK